MMEIETHGVEPKPKRGKQGKSSHFSTSRGNFSRGAYVLRRSSYAGLVELADHTERTVGQMIQLAVDTYLLASTDKRLPDRTLDTCLSQPSEENNN